MGWLIATVALVSLIVALAIRKERQDAARYGEFPSPACGQPFGPYGHGTWHEHARFAWRCQWTSGPHLHCGACGIGFRYTAEGQLHQEQFDRPPSARQNPAPDRGAK